VPGSILLALRYYSSKIVLPRNALSLRLAGLLQLKVREVRLRVLLRLHHASCGLSRLADGLPKDIVIICAILRCWRCIG
jgi:hypothetical protein